MYSHYYITQFPITQLQFPYYTVSYRTCLGSDMEGSNQWKYAGSSKQIFEVGNISVWKIRQYLPFRNFSELNENDDLFT